MKDWHVKRYGKLPKLRNPVLVEGLPGIGNVGKVAVDFMVEELKAKKIAEFSSHTFPHSVFVNDKNLVELPRIEVYCKRLNSRRDIVLLAGDVQPINEESCYSFTEKVLDFAQEMGVKEVITLGGIGLHTAPKKPQLYCTGNCSEIIKKYKKSTVMNDSLYGVVGPIVGVTGLLLGLAEQRNIKAICLLAETLGHPMYLGVKGAREMLKVLNNKLSLKIDINQLDKEIASLEQEILQKTEDMSGVGTKGKSRFRKFGEEVNYIG